MHTKLHGHGKRPGLLDETYFNKPKNFPKHHTRLSQLSFMVGANIYLYVKVMRLGLEKEKQQHVEIQDQPAIYVRVWYK